MTVLSGAAAEGEEAAAAAPEQECQQNPHKDPAPDRHTQVHLLVPGGSGGKEVKEHWQE